MPINTFTWILKVREIISNLVYWFENEDQSCQLGFMMSIFHK